MDNNLQRLTVQELLKLPEIKANDIEHLSESERSEIEKDIAERINNGTPGERDRAINQGWHIMTNSTKNSLWNQNHKRIIMVIHEYLTEYGTLPGASAIAEKTNISRQTATKHLNEFKNSKFYTSIQQQFDAVTENVMMVVYRQAMKGDLKACRLFLEVTGNLNKSRAGTYIDKQQNNNFYDQNNQNDTLK